VPELALDDRQRDPFLGHLDRMRMAELMRREPPSHASLSSQPTQLTASGGG
jgi:hypothetical protein